MYFCKAHYNVFVEINAIKLNNNNKRQHFVVFNALLIISVWRFGNLFLPFEVILEWPTTVHVSPATNQTDNDEQEIQHHMVLTEALMAHNTEVKMIN